MEQSKSFILKSSDVTKSINFVKHYYTVKGYSILCKSSLNSHCFVMKKDSLYRKIMGTVPVVTILWQQNNEQIQVTTSGYMEHSINSDLNKILEKAFNISGIGISRKVTNFITDPLLKKNLSDEAMLISEGAITNIK